ncbi:MAG: hypothetical protein GX464_09045 [Holophagae bacterium]|nr:hypothetical protein [Holophagae bacterium]
MTVLVHGLGTVACSRPTNAPAPPRPSPTRNSSPTAVSDTAALAARKSPTPRPARKTPPIRLTGNVVAPVPIDQPNPLIPEECLKSIFQGPFIIEAVVEEDGSVSEVKAVRTPQLNPPCAAWVSTCLATIAKWRYKPATVDGRPVAVYLTVTVRF